LTLAFLAKKLFLLFTGTKKVWQPTVNQGCQIFLGKFNQKGKIYQTYHKIYQ
jgi:hypothetical protein